MSQLILLYFLLTNGSQLATTVCDNPVDVLKAQAHNVIWEQGSVLFNMKYFAAKILMCPDHHVPYSSLIQCFLSFHRLWLWKKQKSRLTVYNRVMSHISLTLSSQVCRHISAEKVGITYVSSCTVALLQPPSFFSSLLPTASNFCDDLSRPVHMIYSHHCFTKSTSHSRSDLVGACLKCRL